jgi:hypothetical protein
MSKNLESGISLQLKIAHERDVRWDVSNVEETFMTQINWLLVKHGFWDHL